MAIGGNMSKHNKIHQFDRGMIVAIGLLSILSDGWLSDVLVMLSMVLWLWMPEWEKQLLAFSNKHILK